MPLSAQFAPSIDQLCMHDGSSHAGVTAPAVPTALEPSATNGDLHTKQNRSSFAQRHPALAALAAYVPVVGTIAHIFKTRAFEQYVDEAYHVPQTQLWCAGKFATWDNRITTFPGLYALGLGWAHLKRAGSGLLASLGGGQQLSMGAACSTTALRAVTLLFGVACLPLFYALHRRLHAHSATVGNSLGTAATLALFPLVFFFQFLYYTDLPCIVFVLATHLAVLRRRYVQAALAACAAMAVRQNSAVWAAFSLGVALLQETGLYSFHKDAGILQQFELVLRRVWQDRWRLARQLGPLALVPAGFAIFVALNGGVVIGDRLMHTPVWHLVQLLYFLLFAAAALTPATLSPDRWRVLTKQAKERPVPAAGLVATSAAAAGAAIRCCTYVHPYLINDHSHRYYRSYLVKALLVSSQSARWLLLPMYLGAGAVLWSLLREAQPALWVLGYTACTAAVLVPAKMIEFRYFMVPFLLLALHMRPMNTRQLALTAVNYIAINAVTIYKFIFQPFVEKDGHLTRLMW